MDLTVVAGDNFSGRSIRLREWAGLAGRVGDAPSRSGDAFLGPDPLDGLSGLAPTVSAEFELAAADEEALSAVRAATEDLGFGYILPRNPFTLSGGEQTIVAVLAAVAARPNRLAVDCTFEQLAPRTRSLLLTWLSSWDGEMMLADNRLKEWHEGPTDELHPPQGTPVLAPHIATHSSPPSPKVEIRGLRFSYPKGPQIFRDLDLTLEANTAYRLRGPNGVGKSTLSKILSGLLKPDAGEIRIDGVRAEPWRNPGHFASYHFQNPTFQLFSRTVCGELARAPDPRATACRFGLEMLLEDHPLDLPFVLRKRVALGAAIDRPLPFLILDEPTLGQDLRACEAAMELVRGRGGLTISHSEQVWWQGAIDL